MTNDKYRGKGNSDSSPQAVPHDKGASNTMNVTWVISGVYYPEEAATAHIVTKIAEGLAEDNTVHVISGPPNYTGKTHQAPLREERNGVLIERCKVPSLDKNKLHLRIVRDFAVSFAIFRKALSKVKQNDAVLVVTNPFPVLFLMTVVSRLKRARLFILVHDVFPENFVAANLVKADSLTVRVLGALSNWVYRHAHKIVVIGRDMGELAKDKLITGTDRIHVIPNWAETDEIIPQAREKNSLLRNLGLQEKFVVQFAGNLGRVQGVEHLIQAAKRLKHEDIHFLFIGDGAKKQVIEDGIESGELTNITLLPNRPRSEQNDFLNACDLALISLAPGMLGLGVPSKTYNIMAAGKPVVAVVDAQSEVGLLVKEEGLGWVVPPAEPARLAEAILEARSDCKRLKEMGLRARAVAESKYALPNIIESYRGVLSNGNRP